VLDQAPVAGRHLLERELPLLVSLPRAGLVDQPRPERLLVQRENHPLVLLEHHEVAPGLHDDMGLDKRDIGPHVFVPVKGVFGMLGNGHGHEQVQALKSPPMALSDLLDTRLVQSMSRVRQLMAMEGPTTF